MPRCNIDLVIVWSLIVIAPLLTKAQNNGDASKSIDPKARKTHRKAKQYFYNKDYDSAIPLLKKAIRLDSNYIEPFMTLATIHFRKDSHRLRRKALKGLIRNRPDFPNPYYNIASDYYMLGNYRKAYKRFQEFLEFEKIDAHYRKVAEKRKDSALFRAQQKANPVSFDPENLGEGVNTKHSEYWPVLTTDRQKLYFTRRLAKDSQNRKQGKGNIRRRAFPFNEDILKSDRLSNEWTEASKPAGDLNSSLNEGAITIAPNGRYIIFTGCQWPDTKGRCDLYLAEKVEGKWTEPKNLGAPINSKAKETQPSLSFDGQTLYFSSDRKSHNRKLDIYRSKRKDDGSWGEPESLGKPINTNKTEQSPFIHADNQTLFFSSKGHMGMGGSDLFYARRKKDGTFSEPQNLGYPINTKENEIGLFVSSDGHTAYFASKKPDQGFGKLDIYKFKLPKDARAKAVTYLKGKIEDAVTRQNLKAKVRIRNLATGEVMVHTQSSKVSGRFMLPLHSGKNYAVAVTKQGYLLHSENIPLKQHESAKPYKLNIALTPIKEGKQEQLSNIFFDLDKHTLKPTSKAELKELASFLKKHPSVEIEVQGHTDNQGSKDYNKTLAEKRAKSVYDYLKDEKGIKKSRLSYKGYGQSDPIATNQTEAGRAKNRRTTFEITEGLAKQ